MQMEGVACLGEMDTSGGSARSSRKESPENVLSRRGMNKGKGIMVIFSMPKHNQSAATERARRNEEVGFGFNSFGVKDKKL